MVAEKAKTIRFSHPFGRQFDLETQEGYDRTAITVPNLSVIGAVRDRAKNKIEETIIKGFTDREEREREWEVFIALYRGIRLSGMVRSNADVNVPEGFKIVEAWTRRLTRATFNRTPWFQADGHTRPDEANAEKIVEFQIDQLRQMKFPIKWKRFCRTLCMLGTSVALVNWAYMLKRVNFSERIIEDKKERGVTMTRHVTTKFPEESKRLFLFDNPDFRPFTMFDVIADAFNSDIQLGTFAGHKSIMTRRQIKHMMDRGLYRKAPELDDATGISASQKDDRVSRWLRFDPDSNTTVKATDEFEVIEYWGPFKPTEDDEERDYVLTMTRQSEVVLQVRENPFFHGQRPYVAGQFIQDPDDRFYGIGLMETTASLQIELNDTRNMMLNAKDLIVNPMLEIDESADVSDEHLFAEAGRVIRVRQIGHIKQLTMPDTTLAAFRTESIIKADIQEATSSPQSLVGAPQRGDETATENQNRLREANSAIEELLMDLSDTVLTPFLHQMYFLNMQFIREERVFRTLGPSSRRSGELFKVLSPDDLVGQYDFRIVGFRDFAMRGTKVAQVRSMMDGLSRFPQLFQAMDIVEVGREIIRDIFDEEVAGRFFPDLRDEDLLTPDEEHELLKLGRKIPVDRRDNHQTHLARHATAINQEAGEFNASQLLFLIAHNENHMTHLQREQMLIDRQLQQAQVQAQLQQIAGGQQPDGRGQAGGSPQVQTVPNPGAGQAIEAQQAQISGAGPEGA